MNKPVNSDASWLPVAPPPRKSSADASSRINMQAAATSVPRGRLSRRSSSNTSATNPISSDSSSSSERNHVSNGPFRNKFLVSPQNDAIPSRTQSSRSRSRSTTKRTQTAPTPPTGASKTRGRSSSRARTVVSPARTGRSASRTRQPSPSPPVVTTNRGRSSSRTRGTSTSARARSSSRKSRTRSSSRTPATSTQRRSRSSSRTPSIQPRSRSTSRPRPVATRQESASTLPVRQDSTGTNGSRNGRNRGGPPPATSRTRRELKTTSSNSVGPGLPPRHSPKHKTHGDDASTHTADPNLGRSITFGNTGNPPESPSTSQNGNKKRSNLMEKLFGNQVEPVATASGTSGTPYLERDDCIHPRILLTATVYHNMATNLWITTINTNQKGVAKNPTTASKYLKAFSFASEREARESAIANAPPKMLPFSENPNCFLCKGKFAVFRRAGHCRNCGVCVCNNCATSWPSRMIPDTYNLKKENTVKICKSCDALSKAFKKALLTGNYEDAIALYGTGNINLRTPFPVASKKEEIMYPIHCAVEGGNPSIVRWLMDDHFCPIKLIRTGSGKKVKRGTTGTTDVPILTSKGRSVMTIAMSGLQIDILRYLVIERDVSVYEAKDLKSALRALEAALQALPPPALTPRDDAPVPARWDDGSFSGADDASLSSSICDDESLGQDVSITNKSRSSKKSTANGSRNGEAVSLDSHFYASFCYLRTKLSSYTFVSLFSDFSVLSVMTTLLTAW